MKSTPTRNVDLINNKNKTLENYYDTLSTKDDKFVDRTKDK